MSIEDQINHDLNQALKAGDSEKVAVLRMLRSSLKNREIEEGHPLRQGEVISVLEQEAKQRRESIESFEVGQRDDLAEQEEYELETINQYLPDPLSPQELEALVEEAINHVGAEGMQDMGDVMAYISENADGTVDRKQAAELAKEYLQS